MINAFIIVTALATGQTFIEKQIRVERAYCQLPAVSGEYPVDGEWHRVSIRLVCRK